jgi:hypothetical protein
MNGNAATRRRVSPALRALCQNVAHGIGRRDALIEREPAANERDKGKKGALALASERLRPGRFVVWLHGGRLSQAKDLYHTV